MENTKPSDRAFAPRYRVLAVEPDERFRTRITLEFAGIVPQPASSLDTVMADIVPGEPVVVVFGPGLADQDGFNSVQRLARTFPEAGVGKSVVATNLSVLLATKFPNRVALVDADLQFGDDAVLLGIPPDHTSAEAAAAVENMDTGLMESFLTVHEASTLRVLCAPVE